MRNRGRDAGCKVNPTERSTQWQAFTSRCNIPCRNKKWTRRNGVRGLGRRLATETKHALKTTEFYAYVVVRPREILDRRKLDRIGRGRAATARRRQGVALHRHSHRGLHDQPRLGRRAGSRELYWEDSGSEPGPTGRPPPGLGLKHQGSRAVALRRPTVPGCLLSAPALRGRRRM